MKIANQEQLELSGREQFQLADEIADDMTGYGPLRPLLLDNRLTISWSMDQVTSMSSERASWNGSR